MLSDIEKRAPREQLPLAVIEKVSLLSSHEEAMVLVESLCKRTRPIVLSFINAHAYNLCCTDMSFSHNLLMSDLIFRDGIGMQILYRTIGRKPGADLNGTDYIPELLDRFKGKTLALLGTVDPYLTKAAEKLASHGHNIVLVETGYHSLDYYLKLVQESKPEVIILGMGMPRQESLSIMLRETLQTSCLIINGGAILDFWGNKIYRAPLWLRRLKLEWFFRLLQEPKRLFSRYIVGNLVFLKRTRDLKRMFLGTVHSSSIHRNPNKSEQQFS
jgi:exopolysaccharide biosynthesis WecB/TagA/CpsF family protein